MKNFFSSLFKKNNQNSIREELLVGTWKHDDENFKANPPLTFFPNHILKIKFPEWQDPAMGTWEIENDILFITYDEAEGDPPDKFLITRLTKKYLVMSKFSDLNHQDTLKRVK